MKKYININTGDIISSETYKMLSPESKPETPEKGEFKGECNRTACSNPNAVFYNHSTRMYYCGGCAHEINKWAPQFRLGEGHELCVKVESKVE